MKNEFVPYEQALELKQLGFDGDCFAIWSGFDENNFSTTDTVRLFSSKFRINDTQSSSFYTNSPNYNQVSAPTFQQAFRWFREKYNIIPNIHSVYIDETHTKINFWVWFANYEENSNEEIYYGTYEEAELECLKKLIEIVKDGKK